METALRALHQVNVDVGFLQETNLTQDIYIRHGAGYDIWAMEAESWHGGVVVVVYRATEGW